MAFQDMLTEITALVAQIGEQPHDRQVLEILLHEKLATLKAFGMPLPQDLVELEATLDRQFQHDARSRSRDSAKPRRS